MANQEIKNGLTPGMPIPENPSQRPSNQPSYDYGQTVIEKGISPGWPTPETDQSNRR